MSTSNSGVNLVTSSTTTLWFDSQIISNDITIIIISTSTSTHLPVVLHGNHTQTHTHTAHANIMSFICSYVGNPTTQKNDLNFWCAILLGVSVCGFLSVRVFAIIFIFSFLIHLTHKWMKCICLAQIQESARERENNNGRRGRDGTGGK